MVQASDLQAKLLPSYLATVKTIKRAVQPHLTLLPLTCLFPLAPHSHPISPLSLYSLLSSPLLSSPLLSSPLLSSPLLSSPLLSSPLLSPLSPSYSLSL
jgi:hypothetical protein